MNLTVEKLSSPILRNFDFFKKIIVSITAMFNKENKKRNLFTFAIILGVLLISILGIVTYSQINKPINNETTQNMNLTKLTLASGLIIEDQLVGIGEAIVSGQAATFNYTGTLEDGTVFDSSLNPGRTPFTSTIGVGKLIKGWDIGIAGSASENLPAMKVGGKRKLIIPYQLAYGEAGMPPVIPAKAILKFDIELISLKPMVK